MSKYCWQGFCSLTVMLHLQSNYLNLLCPQRAMKLQMFCLKNVQIGIVVCCYWKSIWQVQLELINLVLLFYTPFPYFEQDDVAFFRRIASYGPNGTLLYYQWNMGRVELFWKCFSWRSTGADARQWWLSPSGLPQEYFQ